MLCYRFLCFVLCLFASLGVQADAPVWKVSKGDNFLLIGGTIHSLQVQDYPLPGAFELAYELADALVFEVDISIASSPRFQQDLLLAGSYDDGTTLETHLRPATLARLDGFLATRGMALQTLLPYRAGMVVTLLAALELQRLGLSGMGVDQYYDSRAREDDKPVIALETMTEQIEFLSRLGEGQEDELVLQTLEELGDFEQAFLDLKSAWREGDTVRLVELGLEDFQAFPGAYRALLVERNQRWLPRIESMLKNEQIEYILVGVLHLVGPDSVLRMLQQHGYQVQRYGR